MSERIKKYIIISGSALLLLLTVGLCWIFRFQWDLVFFIAYLLGIVNGMLILGVSNYEE